MLNEYRRTKTTVSLTNYHFVFCPRYRRKIFLDSKVEEHFSMLVQEICKELEIKINEKVKELGQEAVLHKIGS